MLPSVRVYGKVFAVDELPDRHKCKALVFERIQDHGKRLGRMFAVVVAEYDAPASDSADHTHGYIVCGEILPVEAVYVPLDRVISRIARGADEPVVIVAERSTKEIGPHPGRRLDHRRRSAQLLTDLLLGQL